MNEQLENAVVALINKSVEGVESSINFLQAEIPEVVYQLLMWSVVDNLIKGLLYLIVSLFWFYWAIYIPYKTIQKARKNKAETFFTYKDGSVSEGVAVLGINILIIIPLLGSVHFLMGALKIWIAPKVWLLEYAASLVN
jgi:hypothetical protein